MRYAFVSGLTAIPAFIGEIRGMCTLITIVISSWLLVFKKVRKWKALKKKDSVSGEWIKAPVTGRAAEADDVFAKEVLGKGAQLYFMHPGSGEITIF